MIDKVVGYLESMVVDMMFDYLEPITIEIAVYLNYNDYLYFVLVGHYYCVVKVDNDPNYYLVPYVV